MNNSNQAINDNSSTDTEQQQEYAFTPRRFRLKSWTVVTGRRGGLAEFNGHLRCEEGVEVNLSEFIRTTVYPKREAGDVVLDLNDLKDLGGQCYFELLRLNEDGGKNIMPNGQVRSILRKGDSLFTLHLGMVLYICIGHETHIRIANMYNPETDRAELKWNVSQGQPLRITREMEEVWKTSDQFRREFQAEFRAATINQEYEPENSPFAQALRVAKTPKEAKAGEEWTTDGKTTALHVVPTPGEEMTTGDLEVASKGRVTPPAPRRKAKEA